MDLDPLTTSGYFSEFSWHTFDDDDEPDFFGTQFDVIKQMEAPIDQLEHTIRAAPPPQNDTEEKS